MITVFLLAVFLYLFPFICCYLIAKLRKRSSAIKFTLISGGLTYAFLFSSIIVMYPWNFFKVRYLVLKCENDPNFCKYYDLIATEEVIIGASIIFFSLSVFLAYKLTIKLLDSWGKIKAMIYDGSNYIYLDISIGKLIWAVIAIKSIKVLSLAVLPTVNYQPFGERILTPTAHPFVARRFTQV